MNTYCRQCGYKSVFFGEANRPKSCISCGFGEKVKKETARQPIKAKKEKSKEVISSEEILSNVIFNLLKSSKGKTDQLAPNDYNDEDEDI